MQPPRQHSWVNLVEMKGRLVKKLGLERSKQYLDYLNRFLSLKLSKGEFDKLCLRTLGKDNICLHNQLISSVLKNACTKVSSGLHDDDLRTVGNKKTSDGVYNQNGSVPVVVQATSLTLSNGDIPLTSPRKARTGSRDRRVVDRKSSMGPNRKTNNSSFSPSIPHSGELHAVLQNGDSSSLEDQELMQQAGNGDVTDVNHVKQTESLGRKAGKGVSNRTSLHSPLGIPFLPVSIGGAQAALTSASSSKRVGVLHTDGLLDTETLKEHMEQIASLHGLEMVSMDCANVLNRGLDAYLKGLVRSCTELHVARSIHEPTKSGSPNNTTLMGPLNGVRPAYHHEVQSSGWPLGVIQENEAKPKRVVTLRDFSVAMELNCKQLGEDWPVLLEKICTHNIEE
uniref:uncharacterized protein LOC122579018 n=1 Tax=Erigeron canadensis TaxID=72917 RepID=UPI001CB8F6E5|nr:uncharacterized protein LOC122579018 [Erigeron canadensis]